MTLARGLTIVVAVLACAWFALGFVQARSTDRAAAILYSTNQLTPSQQERAASLLSSARTLNPDAEVDILRARLALLEGDQPRAVQILLAATRREPMNIQVWVALAASTGSGPAFREAIARIAELDRQPASARH